MAIPVIDPTTSILAYRKGEFFVYQPAATNTPTSWTATGLPEGMEINGTTGRISGAAEEAGVYNVTLNAINGDGTSAPIFVAMGIENVEYTPDASIEVDVDLRTGLVTRLGASGEGPVLYGKRGDTLILSVGFKKDGLLQSIPVALLNLGFKEYEPEALLGVSDGTFNDIGSYDTTRYQMLATLTDPAVRAILGNYEDDADTYFDAKAEIRFAIQYTPPGAEEPVLLERSSQTFAFRIARDLIEPDAE